MNDSDREKMLDLLLAKAMTGLSAAEQEKLRELEEMFPELKDGNSFELTAAAIGLINLKTDEPMPSHLRARVLADADNFFGSRKEKTPSTLPYETEETQKTFTFEPKRSIRNALGWLVAAAACLVLAINLWMTRAVNEPGAAQIAPEQTTPAPMPGLAEQRQQLLTSASDIVQESWTDIDPKKPFNVEGDVVWSNSQQKGYLRFRNLPVNDKNKEAYQLWIFDEAQKHPVDGGIFNADKPGEIIIPIDPKLKVQKPTMFAVTAEKPGGVVVSDREKVMAIAKLEI